MLYLLCKPFYKLAASLLACLLVASYATQLYQNFLLIDLDLAEEDSRL